MKSFLFKLGLLRPTIYDVMDKFIRLHMSKKHIKYLEHNTICLDSVRTKVWYHNKLYILTRSSKLDSWKVPSCEVFAFNMDLYKMYLSLIGEKIDKLEYDSDEEKKNVISKKNEYYNCLMNIWNKIDNQN